MDKKKSDNNDEILRERKVDIDKEKIISYLQQKNWITLSSYFDSLFKIVLDSTSEEPLKFAYSPDVINTFQIILENVVDELEQIVHNEVFLTFCASLFRALRNYTLSKHTQNALVDNQTILQNTVKLLTIFVVNLKCDALYTKNIKVVLQFLCNLTIFSTSKQKILHSLRFLIIELLNTPEYAYVTSALLYNVLKDTKLDLKTINENIHQIILDKLAENQDNEYLSYITVELLQKNNFYNDYPNYKCKHKLIILDIIKDNVYDAHFKIDKEFITILTQEFKTKCNKILLTANKFDEELEAVEVKYLLDVLACISGTENYLSYLQDDKGLLEECAKLLEVIQCLGKTENNYFTSIQKLADVTNPKEDIKTHPAFGFKADLIRIVGNMCWKNKDNQDQLRNLGTITILLDCCNIDARNPFIMQWAIIAARNLCESNVENQKIIASLTQQGVVSSAVLHEMGVSLHSDGSNQINIVPLDSLKDLQNKQPPT